MSGASRPMGVLIGAMLIASLHAAPAAAAPRCFGRAATIVGTPDKDQLSGTPRRDVIVGLDGRDRIFGRGGDDLLCGGGGPDRIRAGSGNDRVDGGNGFDFLRGEVGNDELTGGASGDFLIGSAGNDRIDGGSGNDVLHPGAGDDVVRGGRGAFDLASFFRSPAAVTVDLGVTGPQVTGEGTDTLTGVESVEGSGFNDLLRGRDVPGVNGDLLVGLAGVDQLLGLDGDDILDGGDGSDSGAPAPGNLNGGPGNDLILGDNPEFGVAPGDDDLYGESGDDILDGVGNVTGPPDGDFGDGGPHVIGDTCFNLESAVGCESFTLLPLSMALPPGMAVRLARLTAQLRGWYEALGARAG